MASFIDLHTHSTASDGTCSPTELVRLAHTLGIMTLALTDHDTVHGIPEFLEAGKALGVRTIPGVELSSRHNGNEAHIVGLFVNPQDTVMLSFLEEMNAMRERRNTLMIERLNNLHYDITLDELNACSEGGSIGRPLVARLLVEKKYFRTIPDVFDHCLRRGMPGYVPRELPPPRRCIDVIHHAGGVAIWAHPVYRRKNERVYVRTMLDALTVAHLDGIETRCSVFSEQQERMISEFAERYKLIPSGGSDFHGENQPAIQLGSGMGRLEVPESFVAAIEARHRFYSPAP